MSVRETGPFHESFHCWHQRVKKHSHLMCSPPSPLQTGSTSNSDSVILSSPDNCGPPPLECCIQRHASSLSHAAEFCIHTSFHFTPPGGKLTFSPDWDLSSFSSFLSADHVFSSKKKFQTYCEAFSPVHQAAFPCPRRSTSLVSMPWCECSVS